jgi:hypothetical protein
MHIDVNLNIHYSAPDEVWSKIGEVYVSMPYWAGYKDGCPQWLREGVDLWGSVEPGGIQIAGEMPEDIWEEWYSLLKGKLTDALGYEIGEPEYGFEFKYWN